MITFSFSVVSNFWDVGSGCRPMLGFKYVAVTLLQRKTHTKSTYRHLITLFFSKSDRKRMRDSSYEVVGLEVTRRRELNKETTHRKSAHVN